jgi:signal transduction histidine kinase
MSVVIFISGFFVGNPSWLKGFYMSYFDFMMMMSGMFFYLRFTMKFLETSINFPSLNKFLKYFSSFVIAIMICYSIIHFGSNNFTYEVYFLNSTKIILLAAGVMYVVLSFVVKSKLMNYLAWGAGLQILFSSISLLMGNKHLVYHLFNSPMFYYELGVISSIVFFLLGLFYKNKMILINKIKDQEAMKLEAEKQVFENEMAIYKAQQEERNRISADMHDDLGAGITSIRLYSELAKAKATLTSLTELEKISSLSDDLINKMNAIIWSMNNENDSLENTVAYMRSYITEYLEGTGTKPIITLPDNIPALLVSGPIRRNVFLVIKEALQNIVKHAAATEVAILLRKEPNGFTLIIHDNGKGIDFDQLRPFSNGLKNMRKRMAEVDIDFKIENKEGTLITLYKQTC